MNRETDEVNRQIKYVEDNIVLKESLGKDATFEKGLVKAWKQWLRKERKYSCKTL